MSANPRADIVFVQSATKLVKAVPTMLVACVLTTSSASASVSVWNSATGTDNGVGERAFVLSCVEDSSRILQPAIPIKFGSGLHCSLAGIGASISFALQDRT